MSERKWTGKNRSHTKVGCVESWFSRSSSVCRHCTVTQYDVNIADPPPCTCRCLLCTVHVWGRKACRVIIISVHGLVGHCVSSPVGGPAAAAVIWRPCDVCLLENNLSVIYNRCVAQWRWYELSNIYVCGWFSALVGRSRCWIFDS